MKARLATFGDFKCAHCRVIVPSAHLVSGVNNRNHCPYCLGPVTWIYTPQVTACLPARRR